MDATATVIWGVIFGSIGLGFFVYGKKQKVFVPLVCGVGLMILPYFISSSIALFLCGAVLAVLPYFIRV